MKKNKLFWIIVVATLVVLIACSGGTSNNDTTQPKIVPTVPDVSADVGEFTYLGNMPYTRLDEKVYKLVDGPVTCYYIVSRNFQTQNQFCLDTPPQ